MKANPWFLKLRYKETAPISSRVPPLGFKAVLIANFDGAVA